MAAEATPLQHKAHLVAAVPSIARHTPARRALARPHLRQAAMVSAGARQPSDALSSSSLPIRASTGSAARWWPARGTRFDRGGAAVGMGAGQGALQAPGQSCSSSQPPDSPSGVSSSAGASAPTSCSMRTAPATDFSGGGCKGREGQGGRQGGREGGLGAQAVALRKAGHSNAVQPTLQPPSTSSPAARARGTPPPCPAPASGSAGPTPPAAHAPSLVAARGEWRQGGSCECARVEGS